MKHYASFSIYSGAFRMRGMMMMAADYAGC